MKNNYKLLIEVNVFEKPNCGYKPTRWTWHCQAKNKLEAINQIMRLYDKFEYGYDKVAKVEFERIISIEKEKDFEF